MAEPFDPELHMTAMARTLRLDLAAADTEAVKRNLDLVRQMADLVTTFPLPDELDPAPVYEA